MMRVILFLVVVSVLATPVGLQAQSGWQWVDIEGAQGAKLRAVVFRPAGTGPFPIVVYLHGINGLEEDDLVLGPKFAQEGFITIVGCWFGQGYLLNGVDPCPQVQSLSNVFAVKNVVALMDAGRQMPGVRRDRVGLVGYSRGGGLAAAVASSAADLQAAVAISARFEQDYSKNDPPALSQVQNLRVPLLILQGTRDDRARPEVARNYEQKARALGKTVEAYYIEGGDHYMLGNARFEKEVLRRSVEFLNKYLRP